MDQVLGELMSEIRRRLTQSTVHHNKYSEILPCNGSTLFQVESVGASNIFCLYPRCDQRLRRIIPKATANGFGIEGNKEKCQSTNHRHAVAECYNDMYSIN